MNTISNICRRLNDAEALVLGASERVAKRLGADQTGDAALDFCVNVGAGPIVAALAIVATLKE
jgi:hypothetical protein